VIGDRNLHVLALLRRHEDADIRLGDQWHLLIGALPDRRILDRRSGLEEIIALEGAEAPVEKLRAFIRARLLALQTIDHKDEPLPATLCGGNKAIARNLRMTGLEPIHRGIEIE